MQADMRVDFVAKTSVYLKLLQLPGLRNSIGLCRFNDAASPFQMYTGQETGGRQERYDSWQPNTTGRY